MVAFMPSRVGSSAEAAKPFPSGTASPISRENGRSSSSSSDRAGFLETPVRTVPWASGSGRHRGCSSDGSAEKAADALVAADGEAAGAGGDERLQETVTAAASSR
jgi:hypothetical protein